jgi:hypothetical protein
MCGAARPAGGGAERRGEGGARPVTVGGAGQDRQRLTLGGRDVTAQRSDEFRFAGFDALPCVVLVLTALGSVPLLSPFGYPSGLYILGALVALALGLRVTIRVAPGTIHITKKWLFIPYWRVRSTQIHDVWYGGDWGLPEGAVGVVLALDRTEVHVGSSRTKRLLFDSLRPLSVAGRGETKMPERDSH